MFKPFTRDDLLMGRDAQYPLSDHLDANALDLTDASNAFGGAYFADTGRQLHIGNAYRPGHYNVQAGGAKRSAHLYCMAIDWQDRDGAVDAWVAAHLPEVLEMGFVGIEHPDNTPGWCHMDMMQRYDQHGQPFQVFRTR